MVSGISAGSINAAGVALFDKGDELAMSEWLSQKWQHLHSSMVYENWKAGKVDGLLTKTGIYNDHPLYKMMSSYFKERGQKLRRKIVVSAVDANTGTFVNMDETWPDLPREIVSSSSIPVLFPDQDWRDEGLPYTMLDGGTAYGLDLVSAIRRCRELVDDDSKITVDAILKGSHHGQPHHYNLKDQHTLSIYERFKHLKTHYSAGWENL